jgi:hypothetical protein
MNFDKLKQFRQSAYTLLGQGKDAIFDLMDAVLTSLRVNSCSGTVAVAGISAKVVKSICRIAFQPTAKT